MINEKAQRIAVFIDTQNLYHSARSVFGHKVNFSQIISDVVGQRQLVKAIAYVIETERGDEKQFLSALTSKGIELKSKELMVFADGSKKADWDVGLAVDVVKMAPRLDTVVILSGDSDFVPLVEYLQEQMMVRVEVASFGRSTGLKLKEVVDAFYDLADKPEKYLIGYRKPRRNTRAKRPAKKTTKK